jgi:hypothetical protein
MSMPALARWNGLSCIVGKAGGPFRDYQSLPSSTRYYTTLWSCCQILHLGQSGCRSKGKTAQRSHILL